MIVFLPLKPQYAKGVMTGAKRYEFRKTRFGHNPSMAVIYATTPIKKVLGYCTVEQVIHGNPADLWNTCSREGGIAEADYWAYYAGRTGGYALRLGEVFVFPTPVRIGEALPGFAIPQSFRYLSKEQFQQIFRLGYSVSDMTSAAAD
ncbi:MAG: hypothetical protein ACOY94_28495 [Bacillota bacterium]